MELNRVDVQTFKSQQKFPLVLILDNIRSMNNVGSVFRTADSFNVEMLCLCGITAQPPHRDIRKSALGAEESVAWQYYPNTLSAVEELKQKGYDVWALEQTENSTSLSDWKSVGKPVALVLGNEVEGVDQKVLDACVGSIEIPQYGTKHSLNISVATGITVWEVVQQLK